MPRQLKFDEKVDASLEWWMDKYFEIEVHTSSATQKAQRHDISVFLDFIHSEFGNLNKSNWTLKTTRNFLDFLQNQKDFKGKILRKDRSINRIMSHLKTFAHWIDDLQPFPLFNPMLKIKISDKVRLLNIDNSLTSAERIKILETADKMVLEDATSKDRNRYRNKIKPKLKNKRPFRNRAVIYCLIETGMKRGDLINIKFDNVNFITNKITIPGKKTKKYIISKVGLKAIKDYLKFERQEDASHHNSEYLFLPPSSVNRGTGKLTACVINSIWNNICKLSGVEGKTPQSSRHAMGKYIMKNTGNPAAVQKQLGHVNPAYSMQYSKVTEKEIENILDKR